MCLIKKSVSTDNLPRTSLGWKCFSYEWGSARLQTSTRCYIVETNKTLRAKAPEWSAKASKNGRRKNTFKFEYGYECGFHSFLSKRSAENYMGISSNQHVRPVVVWGITSKGQQDAWIRGTVHVSRYMRVFDTIKQAKAFKKTLDERLCA